MKKKILILVVICASLVVAGLVENSKEHNTESNIGTTSSSGTTQSSSEEDYFPDDFKDDVENDEEGHEINDSMGDKITIKDESFVTQIDAMFADIDRYKGRTVTVEGIVIPSGDNKFVVTRYYDMSHDDHSHEIEVGILAEGEGEIPAEGKWVRVTGTIDKTNANDRDEPIIKIESLEILDTDGQRKVKN